MAGKANSGFNATCVHFAHQVEKKKTHSLAHNLTLIPLQTISTPGFFSVKSANEIQM